MYHATQNPGIITSNGTDIVDQPLVGNQLDEEDPHHHPQGISNLLMPSSNHPLLEALAHIKPFFLIHSKLTHFQFNTTQKSLKTRNFTFQ
jgi:hypothetical protein